MLKNFIAAFSAEHIKKKGTGLYATTAIVGALAPLLFFISNFLNDQKKTIALPFNYLQDYISNSLMVFTPFLFPLVIIITVSRITQLDHRNGGWQLMETQPLQKFSIYFSKFLVILFANLIAILTFVVIGIFAAYVLIMVKDVPKVADISFPAFYIVQLISRLFVASLFITAFQFVIAVLMPSFVWSMLIGFFFFLITSILRVFDYLPSWYPYEILNRINSYKDGSDLAYWFTYTDYISLFAAILLLCLGFQWFKFKQFKTAFFGTSKRLLQALLCVVVMFGLIVYCLKPNFMEPYAKTVIAGKIESDVPIKQICLIDLMIRDTVAKIPVTDGKFHYEVKGKIVLDNYDVEFDHSFKDKLVIGTNDSVFMIVKFYNNKSAIKITGTRLAENQPSQQGVFSSFSRIAWYLEDNTFMDRPKFFAEELYKEWKEQTREQSNSKTVDNYVSRSDFTSKDQKLTTIRYLNFWEKYLQLRTYAMPNEKTPDPTEIKLLRQKLSLTDESLLNQDSYFEYIQQQLIKKDKRDIDVNLKQLEAIAKLPKGSFKDKMLFWQLDKNMQVADANAESKQLIINNGPYFTNPKYFNILNERYTSLFNLRRGMVAPLFDAVTLDGKAFSLADLKGKLTVIDVWATWCVPCEYQSPYFERLALKYKAKPIQFVALSVDQRKESWLIKAKMKSKSVLQLHANNLMKFYADYKAETIPRFILIDENGNFINSKMPYPEDKTFEILLRKALKMSDE